MTHLSPEFRHHTDGSSLIYAPFSAKDLPLVGFSDIERAWNTANSVAESPSSLEGSGPQGVVFQDTPTSNIHVKFDDYDALHWIWAIHKSFNLETTKGLSVCFRMLALYHLMADTQWTRPFFSFDRKNRLKIDKTLMAAAATSPLTANGLFDPTEIQKEVGPQTSLP